MPSAFQAALEKFTDRSVIGADLSSADWHKVLLPSGDYVDFPAALRERALFSARVTNLQHLQEIKAGIESILNPQTVRRADRITPENPEGFVTEGRNDAEVRTALKQLVQRMGYDPGDKAGGIQDLSSDARINLQLRMNVESAQGYAAYLQGQAEGALDAFPAQELFRAEDRKEKRPWSTRWMQAGGQTFQGRMIALKTDGIWERISRFGTPFPPFDFNSGMWVRDVARAEAIELGLLEEGEQVKPSVAKFNDKLEASVQGIAPELVESLQQSFGKQVVIENGIARWVA